MYQHNMILIGMLISGSMMVGSQPDEKSNLPKVPVPPRRWSEELTNNPELEAWKEEHQAKLEKHQSDVAQHVRHGDEKLLVQPETLPGALEKLPDLPTQHSEQ